MFGSPMATRRSVKDEAEKPFWISFADLMSALMVLFLVVMSAALLSVTKKVSKAEQDEKEHKEDIEILLKEFGRAAERFPGMRIVSDRRVIDFGDKARFAFNSSALTPDQQRLLRQFAPEVIRLADSQVGKRVLKQVVVEGFTDKTGTYLGNLNLSLQRSERVLCALFASPQPDERPLSAEEQRQIRSLFMVGGYSFNNAKETDEESRRIEMRLEFLAIGEERSKSDVGQFERLGACALN
jgi:outer membrane protein OmpA-like peptidoglycan-associated protein